MINMDQGDFAYLVRNAEAGSRPIQALGNREVFYNDTGNVPGGPMPHDNKFYLRLRPTGNTKVGKKLETKAVDLKNNVQQSAADQKDQEENPTTMLGQANKAKNDYIAANGTVGLIIAIGAVIGVGVAIYWGIHGSSTTPVTGESARNPAIWTREKLWWLYTYTIGIVGWMWSYIYGVFKWMYDSTIGLASSVWSWTIGFIPGLISKGETIAQDLLNKGEAAAKDALEKAAAKRALVPK
jgi:hypothetical protein